jgi:hypothetical protein
MYRTNKLRGEKEGNDEEWYLWMHRTALGLVEFSFFFAAFLATAAFDFVLCRRPGAVLSIEPMLF